MLWKLSTKGFLLFCITICQCAFAEVLLDATSLARGGVTLTYRLTDTHSNECMGEWFVGTKILITAREDFCWKNDGENISIKTFGIFSPDELIKKPAEIGLQDLNKESAEEYKRIRDEKAQHRNAEANKIIEGSLKELGKQQCWSQKSFAMMVESSKAGGVPYQYMLQKAASYDQDAIRRMNIESAQAGTHVIRTIDPLSSIGLAKSRVAVVNLAYKNSAEYQNYPGGLSEYVYKKCVKEEDLEVSGDQSRDGASTMEIAKNKCINLGFKSGTESFGQCVLRLAK